MTSKKKEVAPDMRWLEKGLSDPHPQLVNRKREDLMLADMSDEELGGYAFMNYNRATEEEVAILVAIGEGQQEAGVPKIAFMTAVQERLRWLSRQLAIAEGRYPGMSRPLTEDDVMTEALKSAVHKMLETDPSRSLPRFETIKEAETSIGLSQRSYFDPEEAAYYIEDYLNTTALEALLFAARVRDLAKDFKGLGNIDDVSVNQLRQVITPGRGPTDMDASVFSPENDPYNQLYFHSDRAVNTEGVVGRNKHGLSGVTKDKLTDSYLDELQDLGLLAPESRSAAKSLLQLPLKDSQYGEFQRWKKDERRNPIIVGGSFGSKGLAELFRDMDRKGHIAMNPRLPILPDYEGDSLLPKRFQRDFPVSEARKDMFASTQLGKLLARASMPKEQLQGEKKRPTVTRDHGESEMSTARERAEAGGNNLIEHFSTHDITRPPKPEDENWEGEAVISGDFVMHHSVRPHDGKKFVTQCDHQGTPLNRVEKN